MWDSSISPARVLTVGNTQLAYGLGPLYGVAGATVTTFARDGQKSVRAELTDSGVTSSWRYRAYGEVSQFSGASLPSYLGYVGQLVDPVGLLYMRARWYDPIAGRFMSDPTGLSTEIPPAAIVSPVATRPTTPTPPPAQRHRAGRNWR